MIGNVKVFTDQHHNSDVVGRLLKVFLFNHLF
jgi:hypothetical protein